MTPHRADGPRRPANGAFGPQPGEGGEVRQHSVEVVHPGTLRCTSLTKSCQVLQHPTCRRRQVIAHGGGLGEGRTNSAHQFGACRRDRIIEGARPTRSLSSTRYGQQILGCFGRPSTFIGGQQARISIKATDDHPHQPCKGLGSFSRAIHPVQRISGSGGHRASEVNLREPHRSRPLGCHIENPYVLGRTCGGKTRIVTIGEQAPRTARQHANLVTIVHREQAQHHLGVDKAHTARGGVGEHRHPLPCCGRHVMSDIAVPKSRCGRGDDTAHTCVVEHAAAMRIGRRDTARTDCQQHTRYASRSDRGDLERVDAVSFEPAIHHIHWLQPVKGAEPQPTLTHDEICALYQRQAEAHRQVRLFDIRRVIDTTREHNGAWALLI